VSCPLAWQELEQLAGRGDPERLQILPAEAVKRAEELEEFRPGAPSWRGNFKGWPMPQIDLEIKGGSGV
jgi:hypothetical protein